MDLIEYLGGDDDVRDQITIRRHENEVVVDCSDLDPKYDLVVDGDTDESRSLPYVPQVEDVSLDRISRYTYSSADLPRSDELDADERRRLRDLGFLPTYPLAWRRKEEIYQLVGGGPIVELLVNFGYNRIPLHVVESPLVALQYWATLNFPHPDDERDNRYGLFDPEQRSKVLDNLLQEWNRSDVRELDRLRYALDEQDH